METTDVTVRPRAAPFVTIGSKRYRERFRVIR